MYPIYNPLNLAKLNLVLFVFHNIVYKLVMKCYEHFR